MQTVLDIIKVRFKSGFNFLLKKTSKKNITFEIFLCVMTIFTMLKFSASNVQSYDNAVLPENNVSVENSEGELSETKNVATLYVNDVAILNADEDDLNLVLEELKSQYVINGELCEVKFVENVRIENLGVGGIPESYDDIRKKILFGITEEIEYTVSENEIISDLSEKFGITDEEIIISNELDPAKNLIPGQKLNIKVVKKILNVTTSKIFAENEVIPFKFHIYKNSNLPMGTRKVVQVGQNGEKVLTKKSGYLNGIEQKTEILNSKITKVPVDEKIEVGTKKIVPSKKEILENLSWPVSYTTNITSGFGMRGRQMHYGVDISKNGIENQPISAAYDGVVEFAGSSKNGYGSHVIINHGDSVKTLYAHCSQLDVKIGDSVSKNQTIAKVGTTGNSTGYHLHLELIIDGKKVNFLDYCNK